MPLFWRVVNVLRRWREDRRIPEASTVQQWRAVWRAGRD